MLVVYGADWCEDTRRSLRYHYAGVTSLEGPGDRPAETARRRRIAPQPQALVEETAR